jgi:hypothetical protein
VDEPAGGCALPANGAVTGVNENVVKEIVARVLSQMSR